MYVHYQAANVLCQEPPSSHITSTPRAQLPGVDSSTTRKPSVPHGTKGSAFRGTTRIRRPRGAAILVLAGNGGDRGSFTATCGRLGTGSQEAVRRASRPDGSQSAAILPWWLGKRRTHPAQRLCSFSIPIGTGKTKAGDGPPSPPILGGAVTGLDRSRSVRRSPRQRLARHSACRRSAPRPPSR
jgi:hypothetical protein